jgi:DNA polymerase I-like protein with 3'-5' exonuclease and polymerase domains/uracil-DNA glycosylase
MIVGEAPGEEEIIRREPFVGASGAELNRMLHEAGIARSECFITNVCRERPPDNDISLWVTRTKSHVTEGMTPYLDGWIRPVVASGMELLWKEINLVRPNVILALGNVSLWALTGKWGIKNWRGSSLSSLSKLIPQDGESTLTSVKVIPAYHPAYILRDWSERAITINDLKRLRAASSSPTISRPRYEFILRPSFEQVSSYLRNLYANLNAGPAVLSVDIETRGGHIACLGIATTRLSAICIPFMCVERREGYWNEAEEYAIILQLHKVLTHPNARVVGQNFIYDSQYIYRWWGFVPNFSRDTMLGHHSCFSGLPKGLGYLASMYCEYYVYWKDEGKNWDPKVGEEQLWHYNCLDCVYTLECDEVIQENVTSLGLREPHDFQQSLFWPVLQAMVRGVRVDEQRRSTFAMELSDEIAARESWFKEILGHPLNPRSPKQMKELFYEDFKQPEIRNRKTKQVTLDDEAMQKIAAREPLLRPLLRRISEHRSLGVFLSTFVGAKLDSDHRLRSSFNIAGTETYRFSSSQNAFDSGLNFQNIPKGGETEEGVVGTLELPNVRKLFIPDPGFAIFDADLAGADFQVVVEEADDDEFRCMLAEGVDIHIENAKLLGVDRSMAKRWVHGTDYGGGARTMAISCGITVHTAEKLRARWFSAHPGIKRWHDRTEAQLHTKRFVENRFGYRRYYFDRIEGMLPEALAWVPQSTVACYINRIWSRIYHELPDVQVLIQVHDSLVGQAPIHLKDWAIARVSELAKSVSIPYDRPLIIPLNIASSTESWGACK